MSEPTQKADSADAREASKTRVVTHESLLASLQPAEAASEPAPKVPEDKPEGGNEQPKAKRSPNDRIVELINQRREAETKAEAAQRELNEMRDRLAALEAARTAPTEEAGKPTRDKFATDDEFTDALADWKAEQALIRREREQQMARFQAEAQEIDAAFSSRLKVIAEDIPDYEEVVSKSTVNMPDFHIMALKEMEHGPEIVYYLAKNPSDTRRIAAMRPVKALMELMEMNAQLRPERKPEPEQVVSKPKPKGIDPINPVKGTTVPNPGAPKSFAEYKARRKAGA